MKTNQNNKPMATIEVINEKKELCKMIQNLSQKMLDEDHKGSIDEEVNRYSKKIEELCINYDWFDKPFVEDGHYGIKDVLGQVIVPAKFDDCVEFYHYECRRSVIPMKLYDKAVLVKTDGSGEIIPDTGYDMIGSEFNSPFFKFWKDGKFGFMMSDGFVVLDSICEKSYEAVNGVIVFKSEGKYGVLYLDGDHIPATFDEIEAPEPGEAFKVRIGDEWGYIKEDMSFTTDEDEAYWGCPDC